ncbi:MAG: hypothetical protein H6667_12390 [Ardenticatenaceae bacterium]|nr:hypothetical protein [Ardenticatenaceae bacterium]MCB9443568.1 hypothetical protein [Ardenticatenaceae bacterium]
MKKFRNLLANGTLVLVLLAVLALVVRFTLAQGTRPEQEINEPEGIEDTTASVYNVIPIQGRLTDNNGNPLDGYHVITFTLYATSYDTTPLCQDDDSVNVDNGLFNAEMDWCTSSDIDGKRLFLGIQVEGDTEMTPRKEIYPVPYAFSLRPGAIISGSLSSAVLHVENWSSSGRGVRVYAMSETGTNYGIVGASRSPDGYGGYFYNNGGGTGLYSNAIFETGAAYGIHGESESGQGRGVYGESSNVSGGIGVEGSSLLGSGVYGTSASGIGVYGNTDNVSHDYGFYTPDNLYSSNYHTTGAIMQIVQNADSIPLETGDVVAFSGIGTPLIGTNQPVIQVVEAESANSTAVAGVVYGRYIIETLNAEPEKAVSEITPEGIAAPGDYLLVVVHGPAQVKASALTSALQPGDLLSSAGQAGYAAKAAEVTLSGVEVAVPGTVLGKVLEPLAQGEALIYIFVTLQ